MWIYSAVLSGSSATQDYIPTKRIQCLKGLKCESPSRRNELYKKFHSVYDTRVYLKC